MTFSGCNTGALILPVIKGLQRWEFLIVVFIFSYRDEEAFDFCGQCDGGCFQCARIEHGLCNKPA